MWRIEWRTSYTSPLRVKLRILGKVLQGSSAAQGVNLVWKKGANGAHRRKESSQHDIVLASGAGQN